MELLNNTIKRIERYRELNTVGWNGYSADPISEKLIERALNLVKVLHPIPEVYPTANKSIQFEWQSFDVKETLYLEFEIFEDYIKIFNLANRHDNELSIGGSEKILENDSLEANNIIEDIMLLKSDNPKQITIEVVEKSIEFLKILKPAPNSYSLSEDSINFQWKEAELCLEIKVFKDKIQICNSINMDGQIVSIEDR